MVKFSAYREPEGSIKLDLVQVRLWFHPDDSEVEYYELPAKAVNQLAQFVETGRTAPEIRADLLTALQDFPAWAELTLDDDLSKEQRESAAGRFVLANGRRVALEYNLDLDVMVY